MKVGGKLGARKYRIMADTTQGYKRYGYPASCGDSLPLILHVKS